MRPVNVTFVGNFLYPEGLAETKRIQHVVDAVIAGPGNSAQLLLLRQSHPGRNDSRLCGLHRGVAYVTIGHQFGPNLRGLVEFPRFLIQGVRSLFKSHRVGSNNLVYLYGEPNVENVFFVLAAKLLGYKVIVDVVEDAYLVDSGSGIASRLKAWTTRFAAGRMHWFADGVVAISPYLKRKFEQISLGRFPVELVPISVDLTRVRPTSSGFGRPVRLLYAGSFAEKDGIESLITGFEIVASRREHVELHMTGRGSPDRMAYLHGRIASSAAAERIRYLGFLADDDYFRLLPQYDILCVVRTASDYAARGFPFKLGEYLATGRPVIASCVGDIGAYLSDKVNALLVEPGSAEAIAEALMFALDNEGCALAIGRAGRAVAEAHFDAARNGARVVDFARRISSQR